MAIIPNKIDVIIIGGGPGGLSAALWCSELGLSSIVIEKEAEFGGQLLWTFNAIRNHLGSEAANGIDLRDQFLNQLGKFSFESMLSGLIVQVDLSEHVIFLSDGKRLRAKAIIIATGVRRRILGVTGEAEYKGRGIIESGTKELERIKGKTVAVIGGGDAAVENAVILSENGGKVFVIHRGKKFSARNDFIQKLNKFSSAEVLFETAVTGFFGNNDLESISIKRGRKAIELALAVDIAVIRIGVVPNSDLFSKDLKVDDAGYIKIDSNCRTSISGVYAIGDVASPSVLTISNAIGNASSAVKSIMESVKLN